MRAVPGCQEGVQRPAPKVEGVVTSATLDQRIAALIGPDEVVTAHDCPVFLEMSPETAERIIDALRWALYGGTPPPDGRKALLVVLDALVLGLAEA